MLYIDTQLTVSLKPSRAVRKQLFSYRLWSPASTRRYIRKLTALRLRPVLAESGSAGRPSSNNNITLQVGALNVRSINNKHTEVSELIATGNLDIFVATETWHHTDQDVGIRRAAPRGYSFLERARPGSDPQKVNHGGVAVYFKSGFKAKIIPLQSVPTTFECLCISKAKNRGPLTVLAVYRPGSEAITGTFFDEFSELLETVSTFNSQLLIAGDINIHVDDSNDIHAKRFNDIIHDYDLVQCVQESTHIHGHTLYLVIVRSDCTVGNILVDPPCISDHGLIHFTLPFLHHRSVYAIIETRGYRKLDRTRFRSELLFSPLCGDLTTLEHKQPEELFKLYADTLQKIIDSMLPVRKVRTRFQPNAPWFDAECRQLRRNARRLERKYRATRQAKDRNEWTRYLRDMHRQFKEKERRFWEDKISNNSKDPKKLWRNMSSLLGRDGKSSSSAPSFSPDAYLDFLEEKVNRVRTETSGSQAP